MKAYCAATNALAYVFASAFLSAPWAANAVDFAEGTRRDTWLRHPVLGDPSFDAFQRMPGNPVVRGTAPYEWPVNGSLFRDPVSGDWFLYVGHYCAGYKIIPETRSRCTVSRSSDGGATWEDLGPVFVPYTHLFDGESQPMTGAPDCMVSYADGRYHMCFDWGTAGLTWQNAANPPPDVNSGVGYAWAERPEGPFHITAKPIATTREQPLLEGKYRRMYASSLIKRANDWLVLTLTDSGPHFGWALLGMTATKPEGPYTPAKLLLYPESDRFHPPLLEFFPAFVHEGYVYAPSTSVAVNRNFQTLFRVPIEDAMEPEAWGIVQHGSVWHAEAVEHEAFGIWGQTFSGFVDPDGIFRVMFPCRDAKGCGTINLASRPWNRPYRKRGFVFSGHEGPSLTLLKRQGTLKHLSVTLKHRGEVTLLWNAHMPLGPDKPRSNSRVHPLSMTRYQGLRLRDDAWTLVGADEAGQLTELGEGELVRKAARTCAITRDEDGEAVLSIDGGKVWFGPLTAGSGHVGLLAAPHGHAAVEHFQAEGLDQPARFAMLHTEGLLGAAQNMTHWDEVHNDTFRYGVGAVSKAAGHRVKWNVEARAITLWAPKGPGYGTGEVLLDGKPLATIDFSSAEPVKSAPVYTWEGKEPGRHAFIVRAAKGKLPVDFIECTP